MSLTPSFDSTPVEGPFTMFDPSMNTIDLRVLKYILTHIFCPFGLPQSDDHNVLNDSSLVGLVCAAARAYTKHISSANLPQWRKITKTLENFHASVQLEGLDQREIVKQINGMGAGDVLAFFIRAQNAGVIFRKQEHATICESMEVSPKADAVMAARGKLVCSYPGPAIEVPNSVFSEPAFLSQLANFLSHMHEDILDSAATSIKAQTTVIEERDTADPRYIAELLTAIFRGTGGRPADIVRITKRVGDDVVWKDAKLPWRRSPLWLLIRVTLQTSLERSAPGRAVYKEFMLFFMCILAEKAINADFSNDLLHFVSTKISRRLGKLGSFVPAWLSSTALQACHQLQKVLEKRWSKVQAIQSTSPSWTPFQLDFAQVTQLSLLSSRDYIHNALTNQHLHLANPPFRPNHHPRGTLNDFLDADGTSFEAAYRVDPFVALYDVERAVECEIDDWLADVTIVDEACVALEMLANHYSSGAQKTYKNNPEHLSIMLLTLIELWIALDKLAVTATPILRDYSPEVPVTLLESLLLCKNTNLRRLRSAYQYLSGRHADSRQGWSVFSKGVTRNSFAVRYYDYSSRLQDLKAKIEETARQEVELKTQELEQANARYHELLRQADNTPHASALSRYGYEYHPQWCKKCDLSRRAQQLKIAVHEWPLPTDPLDAALVVFELDCPMSFKMWRSATFHLLVDLCSPQPDAKNVYILLEQYSALNPFSRHSQSRITLASDAKPFVVTHYRDAHIPSTKADVCVRNGLLFYGYDSHSHIPVSEALREIDAKGYCTYKLPHGRYCNLQKYVTHVSHTSNEILASQVDCHKDLSLHEFVSFGHLRSGGLIQWLNILRELRERTLSFRLDEVHLLVAQAASEVGPLADTGVWTWHQEMQEISFCHALFKELESLVRDVETNWLEGVTMATASFLLSRLLASGPREDIVDAAVMLLRRVREKTFSWVKELSEKLMESPKDEDLRRLSCDMAVTCRSTYDVSSSHIARLIHSPNDVEILLTCLIFIHDNTPSDLSSTSTYSQLLLARDRRLSLCTESQLAEIIQSDASDAGIDSAIRNIWPGYRPGSKWEPLPHPNARWFSCETSAGEKQCSQRVHLNSLDGTLLVDGRPLSRLPRDILQHPLYSLLFGLQVFDVIPSDIPGMDFLTRGMISEHQVYFSLKGNDLVIRAKRKDDTDIIELIPQSKLEQDLPMVLIRGYAHWLSHSRSTIEIRPLEKLWEHSLENWVIDCAPAHYSMRKGNESLVDIHSDAWKMVSNRLEPLEAFQNLIITVSTANSPEVLPSSELSVHLPRYGLSFFIDQDGELQSRNLSNMVYDADQSTGTLFGLVNQLVLRPKSRIESDLRLVSRCVLIPEGKVSFSTHDHHVRVKIDTRSRHLEPVTYQTYRVDSELGCLTGNVSLTNKLYRAYLHALTSGGYNVDPLTGRTGTEEALSLLRSASCRSIMKIGSRDANLLCSIASLCPDRTWYPEHLKCMQSVGWLNLPVTTQHHDLYLDAKAVKEHCERLRHFQQNNEEQLFRAFPLRDDQLLQRSALRAAPLFPPEVSPQLSTADCDLKYRARDLIKSSAGEARACRAAYAVTHQSTSPLNMNNTLVHMMESWNTVDGPNASVSLQYDSSWLKPDLPSIWIETYNQLRRSGRTEQKQLLFTLPAMAYASPQLADLVPMLIAFGKDSRFRSEAPPHYASYTLSDKYSPSQDTLRSYVRSSANSLANSPENSLSARHHERESDFLKRQWEMYNKRLATDTTATVDRLLRAWPSENPPDPSLARNSYDVDFLTANVRQLFASCYKNLQLKKHLSRVQSILDETRSESQSSPTPTSHYTFSPSSRIPKHVAWSFTVNDLFVRPAPSLPPCPSACGHTAGVNNITSSGSSALQNLIVAVQSNARDNFHHEYISDLQASAAHFGNEMSILNPGVDMPPIATLEEYYNRCRTSYLEGINRLRIDLGPGSNRSAQTLRHAGQWPRITPHTLFQYLASTSPTTLPEDWKNCLIKLALLALEVQRARRLFQLRSHNFSEEFFKELENPGCDGWDAEEHPDWLLIQLQSNFLVRRVQVAVAMQMISPDSGDNTAMQLNMGEGKSSVLIHLAVAALANGSQMVRVIVPKALTAQMFQLLVDRLSGLVNRPVYYLPFSRSLELDADQADALYSIMNECMEARGVLVVQPEHILSLKLMSVEKQLSQEVKTKSQLPDRLLKLQKWLHYHARDILDESDEILHVRYQLVYTIGLQQPMEGFPERWTTTQQVLDLVKMHAYFLHSRFPHDVEYEPGPSGSFPHFRILRTTAGEELVSTIAQDAMQGLLPNFNFEHVPRDMKNEIHNFISREDVPSSTTRAVRRYLQDNALWDGLLLLRGLLATGILLFAFKERRWRVDYGLAPERTMLAVPYRAKDVPAQRAEFGHPDVAIVLTCLSYYYGGLSEEQLMLSFELLLKEDDPSIDYELWVQDCPAVPDALRKLSGVNIKSAEQWRDELFPLFSHNQAAINFYLSRVVFPKEAKEFPSKLSCSGWDLAEKRDRLVTGFSGTNDGQYLLPKSITQRDPDHQRGTNAKVLSYLLQPENNHYRLTTHTNGERRTTIEFLEMVVAQTPAIRVLLDVGAQMLDLQNQQLAATWLKLNPTTAAAVYFNEDDELSVLTRNGRTQLLLSSPFAQQLDKCVIYLDDAHTRGTDIKFPRGFRAAVTLGPKVTKDRLVQGCMRMRKLGHGHSVMFFAPMEIDRNIRAVAKKGPNDAINASDILHWVIRETCDDIQRRAPHWAQQGTDHASRFRAWTRFCGDDLTPDELSNHWCQPEAKSLADLYAPHESVSSASLMDPDILRHCERLGIYSLRDVSMDEEQEREVTHEIERERQVERPPRASPAKHVIHRDVIHFVNTGIIPPQSNFFRPVFETLATTSAATNEPHVWSPHVLASLDFSTAISSTAGKTDEYVRPVQWVLSAKQSRKQQLVILSPYEVNCLLPRIRSSKNVHLHMYAPRTIKSMEPCDDLKLYAIPDTPLRWTPQLSLIDQLNVFAGQLYLGDYATYIRLCRFLCVYAQYLQDDVLNIESDGFIAPHNRPPGFDTLNTFQHSPLTSLRQLISIRRKGLRFSPTHMGKILEGRSLTERDFGSDGEDG